MKDDELLHLRAQIDELDEQLIKLLAQRFSATDRVGALKATQDLPAIDPARETLQAQRYELLAARYGVSAELVQRLFRSVIDAVVVNHRSIRENSAPRG